MRWVRFRAKTSASRTSKKPPVFPEFSGFILFALSLLGLYCLWRPHNSGIAGALLARGLTRAFGKTAYILWALGVYRGLRLIFHRETREPWRYVLVDLLILWATCAIFTLFGTIFLDLNPGGYLGKVSGAMLTDLFGRWGALFVAVVAWITVILWRSGQRPRDFLTWITNRLHGDWLEWRQAVQIERERAKEPPKKKPVPRVLPAEAKIKASDKPSIPAIASMARTKEKEAEPASIPVASPVSPIVKKPATPASAGASARTAPSNPVPSGKTDEEQEQSPPYHLPAIELLTVPDRAPHMAKEEDLLAGAQHLEQTLSQFGVEGKVVEIHPGPIITRFDFAPAPGIKVQAVANLSNDIAMAMKALSVRILAPIPGKAAVGIELPNPKRAIVRIREIFESEAYQSHKSKLCLGLGKDGEGHPYVSDLATMPHLLIGGSTGSGKSVCIHSLVMSILFRASPSEVKLMMIDPKRVELPLYNGIPHLYDPNQNPDAVRVITDPKEASKALEGMTRVMDHRFKKLSSMMARDIGHYNEKMAAEGRPLEPYIVIIIDELADLMAVAPKEVEGSIQRLTQMARAVGIHIVIATQRPSVDVITGVIKANLPARMAFRVASQTDSRVILDGMGAESLLGEGDMLFLPPGAPKPIRLQCGFVSAREVQTVADYARSQGQPSYERVLVPITGSSGQGMASSGNPEEDDMRQALLLVLERRRVSQDLLKAHFGSSARATNILSVLEVKGFIAKPEGTNRWNIYFERIDAYLNQLKNQAPVS